MLRKADAFLVYSVFRNLHILILVIFRYIIPESFRYLRQTAYYFERNDRMNSISSLQIQNHTFSSKNMSCDIEKSNRTFLSEPQINASPDILRLWNGYGLTDYISIFNITIMHRNSICIPQHEGKIDRCA